MKKLLLMFLPVICFGQPHKNKLDSVLIVKDTLYQFANGQKEMRGTAGGVSKGRDNVALGRGAGSSGV